MSKLGDRLVTLLTGGRGDPGPPSGPFRELAEELRATAGSQRKAATLVGVSSRTVDRWFTAWVAGREPKPRPGTVAKVTAALTTARRRRQLVPGRPTDGTLVLNTHDRDTPTRERTLRAGQLELRPGTIERVTETWIRTGLAEAAANAFLHGVGNDFYRRYLTPPTDDRAPAVGEDQDDEDADDEDVMDWWDDYEAEYDEYAVADYDEGYGGDVA